ncbi:DUF4846 domain-containing protein [Mucilaginibacter roseus]|uniref:DUF4846 domain-containing protein n=1 Tax=Mucilaginibacter roseus TaxID=1528868 RepID=A0ABS8U5G2_9SPHI|nr:DUF4846 domain-containing protein [Mucilaginibacter roseus]MCD8740723.1 DUF4846 domain-containing protein [Mucilaginibacter roseus]
MKHLIAIALILSSVFAFKAGITERFKLNNGFKRVQPAAGSFGAWLQQLPLKPAGAHTVTYQGNIARTDAYTAAVVDMSIGKQDLQQCADAVMRLRGEYLYQQKKYKEISFNFTSGFKCDYLHFANGYRYSNGKWVKKAANDYSYTGFMNYMNLVFSYAGTLSLEKELKPVTNAADIKAGDVFIRGGSPGHCFIVMDVAANAAGKKQFVLAQSFMPAQSIQVLRDYRGPWFSLDQVTAIPYGELIDKTCLKRF